MSTVESRSTRDKALFDRIAQQYAAKDSYAPSRRARKLRLTQTIKAIPWRDDFDILEVGCGAGFSAQYLAGHYQHYTGIDYSEGLIAAARDLGHSANASFDIADLYTYAPGGQFDVVFAIGVLHHMPRIPEAMQKMVALLRPGGYLVVNEPQRGNPLIHLMRRVRARVDKSYSDEQEELTAAQMIAAFAAAGLEQIRCRGQGVISTPIAEVKLTPAVVMNAVSVSACIADRLLDRCCPRRLAWNLVVSGRRPR